MGTVMSVGSVKAEVTREETKSVYGGLQDMLENVAMGIEEKQAEMEEMARNISNKHAELT
jgi:hypothetical protein